MKIRLPHWFLVLTCALVIFIFWFLLTKDNYFHIDDWGFFMMYEKGFISMITKSTSEMFTPIHGALYYLLLKFFGLSYIAFQLPVCFFQTLNSYLLYIIVRRETKDRKLALLAMVLFGISSVSIDNLVWSMGINFILAGTFTFLAYICELRFEETKNIYWVVLSAGLLIIAPLAHTIAILYPLVFLIIQLLHRRKQIYSSIIYFISLLINLGILFISSWYRMIGTLHGQLTSRLTGAPAYVATGIIQGVVRRIFIPDLYLQLHITQYTSPVRTFVLLMIMLISAVICVRMFKKSVNKSVMLKSCVRYGLLIVIPYVTVAPFRVFNGVEQSTLHRYTYLSLFFVFVFLFRVMTVYKKQLRVFLIPMTLYLLLVHITASVQFNKNWQKDVQIDKEFVVDMQYLMGHNDSVCDVFVAGIAPFSISQVRFLSGKTAGPTFKKCTLNPTIISGLPVDEKSKAIYNRLIARYSSYYAPFPIPYSM